MNRFPFSLPINVPRPLTLLTVAGVLSMLTADPLTADDGSPPKPPSFRVVIRFYEAESAGGDPSAPLSAHRILFHRGVVYDLPQSPRDRIRFVTVVDPNRSRVMLLDRRSKVRATVPTDHLVKLTAKVRSATENAKKRDSLGLNAEVAVDAPGRQYSIGFGRVSYRTDTRQPADPAVARAFGSFSDWAGRLNIARPSDAPPPFARMTLSRTLVVAGLVPDTMTVTIRHNPIDLRFTVTHELTERLAEDDLKQIREIEGMMVAYREIPFESFPE